MTNLSNNLNLLMQRRKVSVSELARRTGIGQTVIHRLANNSTDNPKVDTLRPIAKFFAISLGQLIGDEPFDVSPVLRIPIIPFQDAMHWQEHLSNSLYTEHMITNLQEREDVFAVQLMDHTMEPKFACDTILVIDPNLVPQDQHYVLAYKSCQKNILFRQLLVDNDISYLKPLNSDFKIQRLIEEDELIGVMIQASLRA